MSRAAAVSALLSTALTHTAQITGASVVTPLPSPSPSGWTISWLTDIGSPCSCMFANLLTRSQELASPSPRFCQGLPIVREERGERRGNASCFKRQRSVRFLRGKQTTRHLCLEEKVDEKRTGEEREEMMRLTMGIGYTAHNIEIV